MSNHKSHFYLAVITCFLSIVIFGGCTVDEVETDPELIPYFDLFADEAAKRGITVDYEAARIEGLIQMIRNDVVLGQCFRNEDKPRKVIIDFEYWNAPSTTEADREFLIYHELGHCFLDREHDDNFDSNGVCTSIMHSTPQACIFELTGENREAYLDELFNQ